ncbi:MAG: hypothetical protein KGL36_09970, partial [Gammaproteobacteria bacterium]|nr:hypothetical protein [Gammaproteobacteria bacterium]
MPERRPPVDRFRRALADATRALAGRPHVDIVFGPPARAADREAPRLPEPAEPLDAATAMRLRGRADRLALRLAHHDAGLHQRLQPSAPRARALYDAIEDARCEILGARALPGVARNLSSVLAEEFACLSPDQPSPDRGSELARALPLWLRERLAGIAVPTSATATLGRVREELERRAGATVERLESLVADQAAFACASRALLGALGIACDAAPSARGPADRARPPLEPPAAMRTGARAPANRVRASTNPIV